MTEDQHPAPAPTEATEATAPPGPPEGTSPLHDAVGMAQPPAKRPPIFPRSRLILFVAVFTGAVLTVKFVEDQDTRTYLLAGLLAVWFLPRIFGRAFTRKR